MNIFVAEKILSEQKKKESDGIFAENDIYAVERIILLFKNLK